MAGDLLSDVGADQFDPHHFFVDMKDLLGWIQSIILLLCGEKHFDLDQVVILNT